MALFLLILGVVLLPEVYALKCHFCVTGQGCTQHFCSAGLRCGAITVATYQGSQKLSETSQRSCILPGDCTQGSVNYGLSRTVYTAKCCDTDLCNIQPPSVAGLSNPNGKKCFSCYRQSCNATVNCLWNEDRCISTTVKSAGTEVELKGCASNAMCSALDIPGLSDIIGQENDCCKGDFCNSASGTSAGLLFLGVPLISLVLFS
ncbi:unnamed protein product [Ophioblennius macclurei]